MEILAAIATFCLLVMETLGYPGLFLLMVGESMILPIPSEAVLPFAGYLASDGRMSLLAATIVALAGTLVGSALSYAMGVWGVRPLLERYGKYVFVTQHHIDQTHRFFERKGGAWTIFLARFVPVVRHLISIPAGSARMPMGRFLLATAAGGLGWNFILLYVGYVLGRNWEEVTAFVDVWKWPILAMTLLLTALVGWIAWRRRKRAPVAPAADGEPLAPGR